MRLIAQLNDKQSVALLSRYLTAHHIENTVEAKFDQKTSTFSFCVWVIDEDYVDDAVALKEAFDKNPKVAVAVAPPLSDKGAKTPGVRMRLKPFPRTMQASLPLTKGIILLCIAIFFLNLLQLKKLFEVAPYYAKEIGITPIDSALFYDYPEAMARLQAFCLKYPEVNLAHPNEGPPDAQAELKVLQTLPVWEGIYPYFVSAKAFRQSLKAPLFEKIGQGQVWRLVSPAILHQEFLHILFNMIWVWILGAQIEQRAGKGRYLVLILIVAVLSNTLQYLMSGPFFLGYSGVITGMGGYIWIRQKTAPWENYTIPKVLLLFLGIFIAAMLVFQIFSLVLQKAHLIHLPFVIANTAHIVGALTGIALGALPFFGGTR